MNYGVCEWGTRTNLKKRHFQVWSLCIASFYETKNVYITRLAWFYFLKTILFCAASTSEKIWTDGVFASQFFVYENDKHKEIMKYSVRTVRT